MNCQMHSVSNRARIRLTDWSLLIANGYQYCCKQKAGTTSLANQLKQHPALSGLDGLPWHEALSKESHFFNGVLGPSHASSATLYKSFFPTILCKWWSEYVRGVEKVQQVVLSCLWLTSTQSSPCAASNCTSVLYCYLCAIQLLSTPAVCTAPISAVVPERY